MYKCVFAAWVSKECEMLVRYWGVPRIYRLDIRSERQRRESFSFCISTLRNLSRPRVQKNNWSLICIMHYIITNEWICVEGIISCILLHYLKENKWKWIAKIQLILIMLLELVFLCNNCFDIVLKMYWTCRSRKIRKWIMSKKFHIIFPEA